MSVSPQGIEHADMGEHSRIVPLPILVEDTSETPTRSPPTRAEPYRFRRVSHTEFKPGRVHRTKSFSLQGDRTEKLWQLMATYLAGDVQSIQRSIVNHIEYTLARTRYNFDKLGAYQATALSVRDRLIEAWNDTQQYFYNEDPKRVYYLSLEFLVGRTLQNALCNLDLEEGYRKALYELGFSLEELYDEEGDAALGNGGLGRLAACFMDSLATLNYPAWGYGIRYEYGMFEQRIDDQGYQAEQPDYWLNFGNPWEIARLDVLFPVRFGGAVTRTSFYGKKTRCVWECDETVRAMAHDVPIPGYDTYNTINIRLWSAKPAKEFDLSKFNKGDYLQAIEARQNAENISRVLYPNDNVSAGKELRLRQQYFFVSATIQDILRRFFKQDRRSISQLPHKAAIQLNDTHPSLAIPELQRILMDEEGLEWADAWDLVSRTFAYTNHTVLPEAIEKWSVDLLSQLLPRHMSIIYEINFRLMEDVEKMWPHNWDMMSKQSLIEESFPKQVRMGNLCVTACHKVNGVAEIHSKLVKDQLFPGFHQMWPDKFTNVTNGVTPRRWLAQSNSFLMSILIKWLGSDTFVKNLSELEGLREYASDPELHREWASAKLDCKRRLATLIAAKTKLVVDPNSLFDIHVKRIHEYKRQLMNILGVIHRYQYMKSLSFSERDMMVPRVVIFGGKAAPGYFIAKKVIKLINSVADVVNNDPSIGHLLKVVFIPNYNVSSAQIIIPASDISQHISTAGTEASGTGNMKFTLNGGIILGTHDGANIEIYEQVGPENMFTFGVTADKVEELRFNERHRRNPKDKRWSEVLDSLRRGDFGSAADVDPILEGLENGHDNYLLGVDFASYIEAQTKIDKVWRNKSKWLRMSILNTAGMGKFSSDRSITEYAKKVWEAQTYTFTPTTGTCEVHHH